MNREHLPSIKQSHKQSHKQSRMKFFTSSRSVVSPMLWLAIIILLLSACGSSNSSPAPAAGGETAGSSISADGETAAPAKEIQPVSLLLKYYSADVPQAEEGFRYIEELAGVKLDIIWSPSPTYDEKVNATLASNKLPEVILISNNRGENIVDAVGGGAFWELGPYLNEFPNLSQVLPEEVLYNISYNGKVYSIPSLRNTSETSFIIRQDWLDKLSLPIPDSIDSFYETVQAFKNNDPDGNEADDTIGLIETADASAFHEIKLWFGSPNGWGVRDGQLVPDFTTDEYLEAMKFFRKLYEEKLINEDFPLVTQNQLLDYINKGKAGLYKGAFPQLSNGWFAPLAEQNKDAELLAFINVKGTDDVARKSAGGGYNGSFFIPKSSVPTEERLKEILGVFDVIASKEVRDVISIGFENVHYKVENGKNIVTDSEAYVKNIIPLRWIMVADGITDHVLAGTNPTNEFVSQAIILDDSVEQVFDPTNPFIKKTIVDEKIIDDARSKYILGLLNEQDWLNAIENWRKSGGDTLIKELNEQYEQVAR